VTEDHSRRPRCRALELQNAKKRADVLTSRVHVPVREVNRNRYTSKVILKFTVPCPLQLERGLQHSRSLFESPHRIHEVLEYNSHLHQAIVMLQSNLVEATMRQYGLVKQMVQRETFFSVSKYHGAILRCFVLSYFFEFRGRSKE
jgi:hypothetical protein